jgi:hypothetical protein
LKLAPDRKIYVGQNQSSPFLGVINDPDSSGLSCNYIDQGIYLNGKNSSWGLNNLMEYNSYCKVISNNYKLEATPIRLFPNPFSTNINIEVPYDEELTIILYDLLGQQISQHRYKISHFKHGVPC